MREGRGQRAGRGRRPPEGVVGVGRDDGAPGVGVGDDVAEVVGLENPPCAAPRAAQEDLGDGTASGHRRNGAGFYGFGVSVARRFRTASAVGRRREEAEGSAETAAAVSARVEGVERVEGVARTPSSPGDRNLVPVWTCFIANLI